MRGVQGNKNWMRAREGVMRCDTLNASARELRTMLPFVNDDQSDSGALDNVMELLVRTGRDIPEVMMMLIPEAWQNDPLMDEDRRAFYQCGPAPLMARICSADGRLPCQALFAHPAAAGLGLCWRGGCTGALHDAVGVAGSWVRLCAVCGDAALHGTAARYRVAVSLVCAHVTVVLHRFLACWWAARIGLGARGGWCCVCVRLCDCGWGRGSTGFCGGGGTCM